MVDGSHRFNLDTAERMAQVLVDKGAFWFEEPFPPEDIDSYIASRHRGYAMHLLASITPSQRWGIGEVAPKGWKLYFKGGWGYGTGLLDHQVALFTRGCARVSIAVLTMYDGSHPYGKDTLKGLFSRLLHGGLPTTPQSWEVSTAPVKKGQPYDKPVS